MSKRRVFYVNWYESDADSWLQAFNSRHEADEYGNAVVAQVERDAGPCERLACLRMDCKEGRFDD